MSAQPFAFGKAILEEIGDERFVVGKRDETVANIARRQNPELLLQTA